LTDPTPSTPPPTSLDELRRRAADQQRQEAVPDFHIDVRPERERVVVSPEGDVDIATVDSIGAQMDELAVSGFSMVVLDLRGVTFMDSTGLSLIVRQSARTDVDVRIVDGAHSVSRLIDLTGVRDVVKFVPHDETPPRP
jgi:anti-sigma B factor antagonist